MFVLKSFLWSTYLSNFWAAVCCRSWNRTFGAKHSYAWLQSKL